MVRSVLQLHQDEMQARSQPSTAPHFVRGDKVTIVTKKLFLRGQHSGKLRDRQLGPFSVEEFIRKHIYRLKLPVTLRLHKVFHVNISRPCSTTSLQPFVPVTNPKGDDGEFDVSHIYVACIRSLPGRRTPNHNATRLLGDAPMAQVCQYSCYIDFMHAHPTRIHESQ
jgi:hypothetical protein